MNLRSVAHGTGAYTVLLPKSFNLLQKLVLDVVR